MAAVAPAQVSANEKLLLRLLLANPEAPEALVPGLKEIAGVAQMPTRRIFEAVFAQYDSGARVSFTEIHDRLNEDDRALLSAIVLLEDTGDGAQPVEQGIACLQKLRAGDVEGQRAALKARIKEAGRNGNLEEALRLSQELDRIKRIT
jgi:hypothetical protein